MLRRLTALAAFAALPASAQQVTTFALDNGMEVVVIEDHRAPAVVHMVWYRADRRTNRRDHRAWRISWNT